jgi:uncharacterized membrane protein
MFSRGSKAPAAISLAASALGLLFSSNSTSDYAAHLDRRLHNVHCSFIPGAAATTESEPCRAAMYSPFSALLKDQYWGGIPISLFSLGAFGFFTAFSLYLLLARGGASRRTWGFFALVGSTPLLVSLVMLTISLTQLGQLCRTCVGIYLSSAVLAFGAVTGWLATRGDTARPGLSLALVPAWLAALGVMTLAPALVYAATAPDQRPYITQCGELKQTKIKGDSPVKIHGTRPVQPTLLFEDPLCPTCKALHDRLVTENIIEKLDIELVLFPLDSECNWMLDQPLHPGACIVSKAVLCGEGNSRQVLEWAYAEQEYLTRAGKAGEGVLRAAIKARWGESLLRCVDDKKTDVRLNNHLHFASENNIPVSTPQMYLGKRRVCDEDTDLGLRFTLSQLAPEVLK